MLDGSQNEVTGLLRLLFKAESIEAGQTHSLSVSDGPNVERDEATLAALAQLRQAMSSSPEAQGAALEKLLDVQGGRPHRIVLTLLHKVAEAPGSSFTHADIGAAKQRVLARLLKHISRFDPAKSKFTTWLRDIAQSIGVEIRKSQEPVKGNDDWDVHVNTRDGGPRTAFSADEEKVGQALASYLKEIAAGQQPFPYQIEVPPVVHPEDQGGAQQQLQSRSLDIFMSHYGLGAPRKSSEEIGEKYKDGRGAPISKFEQRALMHPMKEALHRWVEQNGEALGLSHPDPSAVYNEFMSKLADMVGRKSGTSAIIENDLSGLLRGLFEGEETDPETLDAVARLNAAIASNNKAAKDKAFEDLLNARNRDALMGIRDVMKKFSHDAGSAFKVSDHDDVQNNTLLAIYTHLDQFDPKKGTFGAWVREIARREILMHLRRVGRRGEISYSGGDDDGGGDGKAKSGGAGGLDKTIKAKTQDVVFTPDEQRMGEALTAYLEEIRDGKQPFPVGVKVPSDTPPEHREAVTANIRKQSLEVFMHFYGMGATRYNSADIAQKYKDKNGNPLRKNALDSQTEKWWAALRRWVTNHGQTLGLEGDPLKVYDDFETKMTGAIGRKSGTSRMFEYDDCLIGLLDALETWHAVAND